MRTFSLEGDLTVPSIYMDESKSIIEITGNSTLREPHWFYTNLLKWLIAFNAGSSRTETINIRLDRINESSSKWLVLILKKLSGLLPDSNIHINWILASKNRYSVEGGQMLKDLPGFSVKLVPQN